MQNTRDFTIPCPNLESVGMLEIQGNHHSIVVLKRRDAMGQYSELLIDHLSYPRNEGELPEANRVGTSGVPGNGPYVVVYIKLEGDMISEIRFRSHGCGPTVASASVMTTIVKGKSVREGLGLTAEDVINELGGLPPHKLHCAHRAVNALHNALQDEPLSN